MLLSSGVFHVITLSDAIDYKIFLALPVMQSLESCGLRVTGYDEVSPRQ